MELLFKKANDYEEKLMLIGLKNGICSKEFFHCQMMVQKYFAVIKDMGLTGKYADYKMGRM